MRKPVLGTFLTLALASAAFVVSSPASARVSFGISINEDDVTFAYQDGYWDRGHQWHPWRDPDDWRWYRDHHRDRYFDWRHDRDPDMGWHGSLGISFNDADVMFAYQDGYWDHSHQWHPWRNPDDWRWYRDHHRDRYSDWRHDRDPDMGWHGSLGISFSEDDVMFAYRDGYWDRSHQWHPWRSHDDWRWYRDHHHDRYFDWHHDRDPDMGWHDTH